MKPRRRQYKIWSKECPVRDEIRDRLVRSLQKWFVNSGLTQIEAAQLLALTQARISDIKLGKTANFSLDLLVRLAVRAGMRPRLVVTPIRQGRLERPALEKKRAA